MSNASKTFSMKESIANWKPSFSLPKLLSLGFGILLISWLLAQLDFSETIEIIRNVPLSLLMVGFLCYGLSFYLRALRFRLLLPPDWEIRQLFPIVLLHYTALNIIPARLGELSYVYLQKKINHVSTGYSISSLLLARIFDHIAISILFLGSAGFVNISSQWLKTLCFVVGGILLFIVLLLLFILLYKTQSAAFITKIFMILQFDQYRIIQRVIQEMNNVIEASNNVRFQTRIFKIIGISLGIWLSIFSVNYAVLQAFNINLTYTAVILCSTFAILITILPFQLLNGIGVREATWVFVVTAMGISKNHAIVAAFGAHIITSLYLLFFAIYGYWKVPLISKEN